MLVTRAESTIDKLEQDFVLKSTPVQLTRTPRVSGVSSEIPLGGGLTRKENSICPLFHWLR